MLRADRFRNLLILSVLLGVLVGLFGAAFAVVWHAAHDLLWAGLGRPLDRLWVSVAAGLLIGLTLHVFADPGNMSTIIRWFHRTGRLRHKGNVPILPASLIGLVGGQSAGPEGVLTQVCGSMGTLLGDVFRKRDFVRVLTLAGMGAGFGAFLSAPVGGAILWLEILHRRGLEYYEALIPTLLSSFVGYMVMSGVLGKALVPTWAYPAFTPDSLGDLLGVMGVALGCAGLAFLYAGLFRGIGWTLRRWPMPIYVRTTLAGLVIGGCGYLFPLSYFYGGTQMNVVLNESLPLLVILGTLLAKMIAASVTIKGHWQGGLIIPHLLMGALIGKAASMLVPGLNPTLAMLAGMAAFNAAATQTPLASAMIVLALTGFGHPIPIFLASLTGYLAGYHVPLIEHKRSRTESPDFHLPAQPARVAPRPGGKSERQAGEEEEITI